MDRHNLLLGCALPGEGSAGKGLPARPGPSSPSARPTEHGLRPPPEDRYGGWRRRSAASGEVDPQRPRPPTPDPGSGAPLTSPGPGAAAAAAGAAGRTTRAAAAAVAAAALGILARGHRAHRCSRQGWGAPSGRGRRRRCSGCGLRLLKLRGCLGTARCASEDFPPACLLRALGPRVLRAGDCPPGARARGSPALRPRPRQASPTPPRPQKTERRGIQRVTRGLCEGA